jgi:hypothetical protein
VGILYRSRRNINKTRTSLLERCSRDGLRRSESRLSGCVVGAGFVLFFFQGFVEFGALLGLDFFALLALFVELLLCSEEFDEGLFGAIALLEAGLDDAQVAALAIAVARGHGVEEALDGDIGHQERECLTARVEIALLAEGDHFFDQRTDSLRLGDGGLDAIFNDDGGDQVAQQSAAVAGVASEFESCIAMAHDVALFRKCSV